MALSFVLREKGKKEIVGTEAMILFKPLQEADGAESILEAENSISLMAEPT